MTSMSGIKMDPGLKDFFKEINLNKKHKFAGFRLSDDLKTVVVDEKILGEKANTSCKEDDKGYFEQLKELLDPAEPRFLVYDFGYKGKDGRDIKKLAFLYWCHNDCPVKKRMMYASTKDDVKKTFNLQIEFQVNDLQDMDYDEMSVELLKKISS